MQRSYKFRHFKIDFVERFAKRNLQFTIHTHNIPTIFLRTGRVHDIIQYANDIHFTNVIVPSFTNLFIRFFLLLFFYNHGLLLNGKRGIIQHSDKCTSRDNSSFLPRKPWFSAGETKVSSARNKSFSGIKTGKPTGKTYPISTTFYGRKQIKCEKVVDTSKKW